MLEPRDLSKGLWRFRNKKVERRSEEIKSWISLVTQIFGLRIKAQPSRPLRIVIDLSNETKAVFPDLERQESLREWIQSHPGQIESIVVIQGDQIVELR